MPSRQTFSDIAMSIALGMYKALIVRNSQTEIAIKRRPYTNGLVEVNEKSVDVTTEKTVTVGTVSPDKLIDSDGSESVSDPSADQLYYLYLSNDCVAGLEELLRLSDTAPNDDGYMDGTADAENWRFVGAVYLDSFTQVSQEWNLAGIQEQKNFELILPSTLVLAAGGGAFEDVLAMENVVVLEDTKLDMQASVELTTISGSADHAATTEVDGVTGRTRTWEPFGVNESTTIELSYKSSYSTIKVLDVKTQFKYFAGATWAITPVGTAIWLGRSNGVGGGGASDDVAIPEDLVITVPTGLASNNGSNNNGFRSQNLSATGTSSNRFQLQVPDSWDELQDPSVLIYGQTNSTGTSQSYRFEFGPEYLESLETVNNVDSETIAFTQLAPDGNNVLLLTSSHDLDGSLMQHGDIINMEVRRIGGHGDDDRPGGFRIAGIKVRFPRKNLGVTT